ncbi:MAG: thiol:disulfide interchange protein DsbA/DsbL [Neisseriaceae bacterium]|nr:thiol:disulfide interchange protein DsbA/DsbL [Neisseriaceae bacterium]
MKFNQLKNWIATAVLGLAFSMSHAEIVEGKDYTVLPQPIPQEDTKKIEVMEFFAYSCSHCYHLEEGLMKEVKAFPEDVYYRPEHVVWDPSMVPLARIAAAAKVSNTVVQANHAVFELIFVEKDREKVEKIVVSPEAFKAWANQQGAWGKNLAKAYDDKKTEQLLQRMQQMTLKYKIDSTPSIIIGGKYRLNDARNFNAMKELIEKVRQEKTSKPAKPFAKQHTGANLAAAANH